MAKAVLRNVDKALDPDVWECLVKMLVALSHLNLNKALEYLRLVIDIFHVHPSTGFSNTCV